MTQSKDNLDTVLFNSFKCKSINIGSAYMHYQHFVEYYVAVFHRHDNVRSFLVCSFSRRPSVVLLSPPSFPARGGPVGVDRSRAVVARTPIHFTVTARFSSSSNSAICLLRVRRSWDYIATALLPPTTPDLISGTVRLLLLRSPRVPCCVSVCHKTKK